MTALVAAAAVAVTSTSYCLQGTMADGTQTRYWSAAHNGLALGTRIWVEPAVRGRHRWTIRDRIGYGTQLDLWTPSCGQAIHYGRRTVRLRVGWPHVLIRRHRHPQSVGGRSDSPQVARGRGRPGERRTRPPRPRALGARHER